MKVTVVIPAYNEGKTIQGVVRSVLPYADRVIVVDDGSSDRTGAIAEEAGARLVRHVVNRGLGAAIGTGVAAALREGCDAVVTFDADGQHRPEDVPRVTAPIADGRAEFVVGSRTLDRGKMPLVRRIANWVGNALTWALFGLWVSDSQSGLRAFSSRAAEELRIRTDRMEVSSEIIHEAKRNGWRIVEIPIVPIYTEYSMSKGQGFVTGLKTAGKLILRRVMR